MATASIRLAAPGEIAGIYKLSVAAASDLVDKYGQGRWRVAAARKTLKRNQQSDSLFVIVKDAVIVGTFCFTTKKAGFYRRGWFAFPDDPAGYLLNMAIAPQHQRQGIGREVMNHIDQLARSMKLLAVRFDAYEANAGAGGFYRKCGYQLVHVGKVGDVGLEYYEKVLR